jgi:hypothetical protein
VETSTSPRAHQSPEGRISAPAVSISRARDGGVEVEVADIAVVAPDVDVSKAAESAGAAVGRLIGRR